MNILIAREEDGARFVFSYGEHQLGVVLFLDDAIDWMWVQHGGGEDDIASMVHVDREQTERFISERQSIAMQDEPVRSVRQAEWLGRVRMFRDETVDMAVMYGKVQARKLL